MERMPYTPSERKVALYQIFLVAPALLSEPCSF